MRINTYKLNKKATVDSLASQDFWQHRLPQIAGAGLAGGIGIRSLAGLVQLLSHNTRGVPQQADPTVLDIPYRPNTREELAEEEEPKQRRSLKFGSTKKADVGQWWADMISGKHSTGYADNPIAWPVSLGVGAAAGATGYKATDMLFNRQKKKMLDEELNDAREDYHQALMQQFTNPIQGKKLVTKDVDDVKEASLKDANLVKNILDSKDSYQIGEELEKLANWWDDAGWLGRTGLGMYMAAAPALALGTGVGVNHYLDAYDADKAKTDAMRKAIKERTSNAPEEVFANFVPVDERGKKIDMNKRRNQRLFGPDQGTDGAAFKEASQNIDLDLKATEFVNKLFGKL